VEFVRSYHAGHGVEVGIYVGCYYLHKSLLLGLGSPEHVICFSAQRAKFKAKSQINAEVAALPINL
jgi:hypothetical protein